MLQIRIQVLILATGFRVHEYFGPMEIVGRKGENILRKWKVDGPSIYLGIVSEKMPNLFFIHGPGVVSKTERNRREVTEKHFLLIRVPSSSGFSRLLIFPRIPMYFSKLDFTPSILLATR